MDKKYLPIGSVVTLKGNDKLIMISGYSGINYDGNINYSDYIGLDFPEGLLSNTKHVFNHSDIDLFKFKGFIDDSFAEFNSNLLFKLDKIDNNLIFDDKGTVIADSFTNSSALQSEIKNENPFYQKIDSDVSNNNAVQYQFDENGVVIAVSDSKIDNNKDNVDKYHFDSNGTVIGINNEVAKVDDYIDYSKDVIKSSSTDQYTFDSNGTVVSINNSAVPSVDVSQNVTSENEVLFDNKQTTDKYTFDENGRVISINSSINPQINQYKFDSNGTVIA